MVKKKTEMESLQPQPFPNLPNQGLLHKSLPGQTPRVLRPRLRRDHTFGQRRLQRVDGLLDATLLGDEIVQLLSDDGGWDEHLVDGWEAGSWS